MWSAVKATANSSRTFDNIECRVSHHTEERLRHVKMSTLCHTICNSITMMMCYHSYDGNRVSLYLVLESCGKSRKRCQNSMSFSQIFGKSFRIELSILDMCRNRSLNTQNIPTISNISHKHPSDTAHTFDSFSLSLQAIQTKIFPWRDLFEIFLAMFISVLPMNSQWSRNQSIFHLSNSIPSLHHTQTHDTREDPKKVESWIPFSLFACFFLCALTHPKSSSCKVDAHFYRVHMLQSSLSTLSPRMVGVKLME